MLQEASRGPVEVLAEAKALDSPFLYGLGLRGQGAGVQIPYYAENGSLLFERFRNAPGKRPRFIQPDGVSPAPYGLWKLEDARSDGELWLAEGESDTWALWRAGFAALGFPGDKTFRYLEGAHLRGIETLYLCPHNDEAGRNLAAAAPAHLNRLGYQGRLHVLALPVGHKGDVCDFRQQDPDTFALRLRELAAAVPETLLRKHETNGKIHTEDDSEPADQVELVTRCLATVKPLPIRWKVPGRIAAGKLNLLAADGGVGKSTLTLHLAARLSRGECAFGMSYPLPAEGEVLLLSCEDDLADTVVPRLLAQGADLSRCHAVEGLRGKDGKLLPFSLAHLGPLARHLEENPSVQLVIIDPIATFVGRAKVDEHKEADLRAMLEPIGTLAGETGVAFLLIKHFSKAVASKVVSRVLGSVAYVNTVRLAYAIVPHPEEDGYLLCPMKSNISPKKTSLHYCMESLYEPERAAILGSEICSHLDAGQKEALGEQLFRPVFLGEVEMDADQALSSATDHGRRGPKSARECEQWLRDYLGDHAHPCSEVFQAGKVAGWSRNQLYRAKDAIGANTAKQGWAGGWVWGLAAKEAWIRRPDRRSVRATEGRDAQKLRDLPDVGQVPQDTTVSSVSSCNENTPSRQDLECTEDPEVFRCQAQSDAEPIFEPKFGPDPFEEEQ